tara:strand:- start:2002 stop:2361 length:360 start_codon:yes stop_codon:yes gene_type:complete
MSSIKRVVVVDDDVLIAHHLRDLCADAGTHVVGVAHQISSAQEIILAERPDYVIMDLRLGEDRDGVDLARDILKQLPKTKFIFVTASAEVVTIARIETVRPERILIKPIAAHAIGAALS